MKKISLTVFALTLTLSIAGCGNKKSNIQNIPQGHDEQAALKNKDGLLDNKEEIKLYNHTQSNAAKIKNCALIDREKEACNFSDSPLIGFGKTSVTVKDIMDRTMSPNIEYMETFKSILESMPPESLAMFGSINAVVISDRINPSYYDFISGAIYLQADFFWKKTEDKKKATQKQDYRNNFGNQLKFTFARQYAQNGKSMDESSEKDSRSTEELKLPLINLLFHELAHANDFYPRSFYQSEELDQSKTYTDFLNERWEQEKVISQKLSSPHSDILFSMGQVLFHGKEASADNLNASAEEMLNEFTNDTAADIYAYSTPREDLAMLTETSMTYHYYGYSHYSLVLARPYKAPYPLVGGIKNKMASPQIKERVSEVLTKIFEADYSLKVIQSLDKIEPVLIPAGTLYLEATKL